MCLYEKMPLYLYLHKKSQCTFTCTQTGVHVLKKEVLLKRKVKGIEKG